MDIALFLISAILIGFGLVRSALFEETKIAKWLIICLFTVKILGAIGIWSFYEKMDDRKNSDIFKYYDDGLKVKEAIKANPVLFSELMFQGSSEIEAYKNVAFECGNWETENGNHNFIGNRLMIRSNAMLSFVFGSNYFLHLLTFTSLSFLGILFIVKTINSKNKKLNSIALCVLTLSPSLIFWTSGILKESLLIFFIGLLIFHVRKIQLRTNNYFSILISLLSLTIIWMIRSSMGYCFGLGIIFGLLYTFLNRRIPYAGLTCLLIMIISSSIFLTFNSINEKSIIGERRMEFLDIAEIHNAGSTYDIPVISTSSEAIFKLPFASFNALFRPSILDIKKGAYIPFAMESLFMLTLIFFVVFFNKGIDEKQRALIYSLAIIIFSMSIIIGLTVPIFGASVRYRAPLILLFYAIFMILLQQSFFKIKPIKITKINP